MTTIFVILFLLSSIALVAGLRKPSSVQQESKKRVWQIFGTMTAVFFVLIGISSPSGPIAPTTAASAPQPSQTETPTVGESGYIQSPSPKAVLASTEDNFKELMKILIANDMYGLKDFLLSGKGFAVPNGTKVQVVDSAVGSRKVRVLEGDFIGEAGWIAMEWVSKNLQ